MQFQNKIKNMSKARKMVFIALLVTMALVLSYIERFIPLSFAFPGIKLGLANVITLAALYLLTFKEVTLLVIVRVIMNAMFVSNFISFWYSLAGGLLSLIAMYITIKTFREKVSPTGVSIIGAVSHNIGQLCVIGIVTNNIKIAISYFPILALSGTITGILIGLCVKYILQYVNLN